MAGSYSVDLCDADNVTIWHHERKKNNMTI